MCQLLPKEQRIEMREFKILALAFVYPIKRNSSLASLFAATVMDRVIQKFVAGIKTLHSDQNTRLALHRFTKTVIVLLTLEWTVQIVKLT